LAKNAELLNLKAGDTHSSRTFETHYDFRFVDYLSLQCWKTGTGPRKTVGFSVCVGLLAVRLADL
jgi:hypothetical protein